MLNEPKLCDRYECRNSPTHYAHPSEETVNSQCSPGPMAMCEKTARDAIDERIEELRRQISELETLSGCLPQVLSDRASARVRDLIGRIR